MPNNAPLPIPVDRGLSGATLQNKQTNRLPEPASNSHFVAEIDGLLNPGGGPMISLPVLGSDQAPLAVMQLYRGRGDQPFGDDEENKLQRFTDTVGILL